MQQHNDPPRVCASIPGESPMRLTQRVSQANRISDIPPMKNAVPHPHQETWFGQLTHTRKDYMRLILIFFSFRMWTIFFKSLLNSFQYCFFLMFWFFVCKTCGILAPQPGIEPVSLALKCEGLTTGRPGKSWIILILEKKKKWTNYSKQRYFMLDF